MKDIRIILKAKIIIEIKFAFLNLSENSLSNVGYSPESIGTAFSMEEGELTRPFKIDGGMKVAAIVASSTANLYIDELSEWAER